ncbi:MAG: winged helix DNA-binding domain-containing protein [Rhodobacteraceae bacterium]|nr:winged helix DNA-binding domain-containing protein [Paracoccaceae bacterium]
MGIQKLDNKTARRLFLDRHALAEQPVGPARGGDLLALIHRLGFVQLDSINTVARAHDMILFSRRPAYRPSNLIRLYESQNVLFEHWTHDAAMIPMGFYPHWNLRFRRDAAMLKARWRNWRRDGFEAKFAAVLQQVRDHGPCCSSDVGQDEKKTSGGWWDWHPSKTALEYLWRSGALAVTKRKGFQKYYDLCERVIDSALLDAGSHPDEATSVDWLCNAALERLGFATSGELAAFWATVSAKEAKEWCANKLLKGEIAEIDVVCADGSLRRSFAHPDAVDNAAGIGDPPGRIRVLSPFDPALRDRKRAERLFGFHYRVEMFVPEPKRKYGYYVFPLLQCDRLIGRIDMKARRDYGALNIRALWPERRTRWSAAKTTQLKAELSRVARFCGLDRIEFEPDWLRDPA